jgi:3'(2'), 5'-bisphosphate nucleotidase
MNSRRFEREQSVAIAAVERACRVCRSVQSSMVRSLQKQDRSPATVADFAAQAVVSATLAAAFPGEVLLAEEQSRELREPGMDEFRARVIAEARAVLPELDDAAVLSAIDRGASDRPALGRWWVLDPLDGTKGFLRREQYAVALALLDEGRPVLAVLGCPELPQQPGHADGPRGCLFVAAAGEGARWRPLEGGAEQAIAVDRIDDPAAAVLCESVEPGHSSHEASARVLEALGVRAAPCRFDSQCKYAAVARGEATVYLRLPRADYEEKVWDHAAGALLCEEAGGTVTDLRGVRLDFSLGRTLRDNYGVVVTNGRLHQQVLAAAHAAVGRTKDHP